MIKKSESFDLNRWLHTNFILQFNQLANGLLNEASTKKAAVLWQSSAVTSTTLGCDLCPFVGWISLEIGGGLQGRLLPRMCRPKEDAKPFTKLAIMVKCEFAGSLDDRPKK